MSDSKYAYRLMLNKVTCYARNVFRPRAAAVICAVVAGCSLSPAGAFIESLDARPQQIPAQQGHTDAREPIIRFAQGELPDDAIRTRLAGGGTVQSSKANPEAGLAAPAVAAVWVELQDGRRVNGQVVDHRPAIDTSVYFFVLDPNADAQALVAADGGGAVLTRIDLDGER